MALRDWSLQTLSEANALMPLSEAMAEGAAAVEQILDEVLAAEGIWAVFYDGKPINLKSSSLVANYPGPKYKKVSFSNPGHAENLAKKLNAQHNTDKFGVYLLKSGDKFSR